MATTVKIKQAQLAYFRSIARDSDKEVLAYLVGEVKSEGVVVVDYIAYTDRYCEQTTQSVRWCPEEYHREKEKAEERGRRIIGDIHSHPNWDAVMSPADHLGCITAGFRVCGIVSVYDRKTRVRFWVPDSALPCEVEYVKKAKGAEI